MKALQIRSMLMKKGIMEPKYPIYIISKGRSDTRMTSKALEKINTPYRIVIEPQEYDQYSAVIHPDKILQLPFSNLGQGSIPARNWVMDHSRSEGHKRHWILDDNIGEFFRFNKNKTIRVKSGTIFRCAEDFIDRYENIALAGFQYYMFIARKKQWPAVMFNTRIYSCILINNSIQQRWRGRYNEDTDLSLRVLKDGLCTVLFNTFLCEKKTTMTMKGGNTESLYEIRNGRRKMAQSLVEQHPDVTRIVWKWGRWQHHVDYRPFKKNKLIRKPGIKIPKGNNEFGMKLIEKKVQRIGG